MKVLRLDHAQVTVPSADEAAARRFYLGVLGLAEIPKPAALAAHGGFWTALGGVQIHIGLEDGVVREQTRAHIAFEVAGIAEWRTRLEKIGMAPKRGSAIVGLERLELRDPSGNCIELLEKTSV